MNCLLLNGNQIHTNMSKKIEKFEDLNVWKDAMNLSVEIYNMLQDCKDFGLRDQMQRSSVLIPSNIAEGYERNSKKRGFEILNVITNAVR